MTNIWCVRADNGSFTHHFVEGGYAGIGWMPSVDLGGLKTRDEVYQLYKKHHPDESNLVVGQQVGQITRFLFEIQAGDYVVTPEADPEWLRFGQVGPDPSYFHADNSDGCRFVHRRKVAWSPQRLKRADFSVPFQNTMRSSLTVFSVSQREEFLTAIGRLDLAPKPPAAVYDPYRAVLGQVLQLDDKEFEILVGHLLTALGFEGSQVTGKPGDGGVDATGVLNVANLVQVKLFVQAKRYKGEAKIRAKTVRALRQAIPSGGQGAFITTADFDGAARDVATEAGFPRIGLVNGRQLVDLLVEHWEDIPPEFRERLGLKPGLVLA